MDTVILKTKRGVGSFEFRRETKVMHPETKKVYSKPVLYRFDFDNDFKTAVPKQVWEDVRELFVDSKNRIRYSDILQTL
jgi:hypothetical protein